MNLFSLRRSTPSLEDLHAEDFTPSSDDASSSDFLMPSIERPKQVFVRGQGSWLWDSEDRAYLDFSQGKGANSLGHSPTALVNAITAQAQSLINPGFGLHNRGMLNLAERLCVSAGSDQAYLLNTGSEACEAAIKLAKIATGRKGVFCFSGGYHGMTHGALSLMGNLGPKQLPGSLMPDVQVLPYPYDYRCPFSLGGEAGVDAGLSYLEQLLSDPESGVPLPAAVVVEVVQGEGGVIPAPTRWLQGLRKLTQAHGVVLIIDEVQSGIGRTGRMFAFEHADITPDVVVISKAVGGGLPLAVVVYQPELDLWKPGSHAGTFRGNQLAMAAGTAALNFIAEQGLVANAERMGDYLMTRLRQLQRDFPCIGDVRGRGLMVGIEIVSTAAGQGRVPAGDGVLAKAIQHNCLREGVILELGGRHGAVVRFLPPLTIDVAQVDTLVEKLQLALMASLAATKE